LRPGETVEIPINIAWGSIPNRRDAKTVHIGFNTSFLWFPSVCSRFPTPGRLFRQA
jgi:hypothetical protein